MNGTVQATDIYVLPASVYEKSESESRQHFNQEPIIHFDLCFGVE
jgi:hypothetical protein